MAQNDTSIVLIEQVQSKILFMRGQKVILDSELAALYGVPTKRLNEQIKRNNERFPPDFMFQLTAGEAEVLRSQFATSNERRGGRRYKPYAFTEHGAIMAASVLNSERAVQASIYVVRAFVKLRQMLAPYKELIGKLDQLEKKLQTHDKQIISIIQAIKLLMPPPEEKPKEPFGFHKKKTSPSKGIY
jgi:phage regulator Rha-like protein